MGAKRFSGLGGGPNRVGWALLAVAAACALAVMGGSGGVDATRAVAVSSGALVATPAASTAAGDKTKHLKYKTVKTLAPLPWREVEHDALAPSKRSGHSVTAVGRKLYVFGGCYLDEVCFNDLRVFDTVADAWTDVGRVAAGNTPAVSAVPSVRGRHTANRLKTRDGNVLVIFGGSANELYRNDVYLFDVKRQAWSRPMVTGVLPVPRAGHAAAVWHGRLYVAGGYTPNGYTNDLAVLDTTTMAWSAPPVTGSAPSPRAGHSFTRIAVAHNLPLSARAPAPPAAPGPVGLEAEAKAKAEAAKKHPNDEKKRKAAAAAAAKKKKERRSAEPKSERLVLFGGANDRGVLNDLYVFDAVLGTWSRPAITGLPPSPRHDHVAAAHDHFLWFNGGCDIRALTCHNDTVVLDTDAMAWQDPRYPVTLKQPYVEHVADPDGVLSAITNAANAAVKKDNARRAAKEQAKQQKNKKKRGGLWSRLKKAVGRFQETGAAVVADDEAAAAAADDQRIAQFEHAQRDEQLTSATSGAAARFVEQKIDEQHVPAAVAVAAAAAGPQFGQINALVETGAAAAVRSGPAAPAPAAASVLGPKRHKRKRHSGPRKRPAKTHVDEDPVRELSARGGHAGAFVHKQNALYVVGGCYLEQGCTFNLLYLHVPKTLQPVTRTAPGLNESPVTNVEPARHPRAATSTIASRREAAERARAERALHDKLKAAGKLTPKPPAQKKVDAAHVGLAFLEEDESFASHNEAEAEAEAGVDAEELVDDAAVAALATQAAADDEEMEEIEIEVDAADSDESAAEDGAGSLDAEEEAEDAAFLQEHETAGARAGLHAQAGAAVRHKFKLLHGTQHQTRTSAAAAAAGRAGNALAHSHSNRAHGTVQSTHSDSASDGDSADSSESESESDDLEVDITAEARARVHARLIDEKRARILAAVQQYHRVHPQRGERDLSRLDREARDAAEVDATLDADLHGGIGLYSDGQLQIGANYTESPSKLRQITDSKLFLPLVITIGLIFVGCLVLVLVWFYMRDREHDAEEAAQRKRAAEHAQRNKAVAAAAAAGLDPRIVEQLQNDEGARLAFEKDLMAAGAVAAALGPADASAAAAASSPTAAAASEHTALLGGDGSSDVMSSAGDV